VVLEPSVLTDQELTARLESELITKALVPSHRPEAQLDQSLVDQWLVDSVAQWAAE
jgi:hypothetical protein